MVVLGAAAGPTRGEGRYRWVVVLSLAFITTVSYGTMLYAFSVLLGDGAAAAELGRALPSGALALGVVVSGALAPLIGTVCDVLGSRRVFLAGAVLGGVGLAAFSRATEGWQVLAAWGLLVGPAMACTFYEPAYVTVEQWFSGRGTGKALGVLTLLAGLSATIFVPLTQRLVSGLGWRDATLVLAVVLLAGVALPALLLRDKPHAGAGSGGLDVGGAYRAMAEGLRHTNRAFWCVAAAYFLALAASFALLFHQIAYMREALGFSAGTAALAVGLAGLVGLPGRLLLPALGDRVPPSLLVAAVFAMLGAAALLLPGSEDRWRLWLYVGLSGVSFGAILPMRAVIMARHFAGPLYGRLMGLQFVLLALATAGGPLAAGVLRDASGSYAFLSPAAIVLLLLAIPTVLAAEYGYRSEV